MKPINPDQVQAISCHDATEHWHLVEADDCETTGFLPVARELADRLARAGVRYGIYKNTRSLGEGLAGQGDLDLLVASEDAQAFRIVMSALNGVRGASNPLYDNVVPGREDWFIPEPGGGYLHLDTSFGLCIGRKFRKRYAAMSFEDVTAWQLPEAPLPRVSFVAPQEEARIAVLRALFRLPLWPGQSWVRADAESSRLLERSFAPDQESAALEYRFGTDTVACTVRRQGGAFVLEARAIRRLRTAVRARNGRGPLAAVEDFIGHHLRHFAYFATRQWTRGRPGRSAAKRRLEPAGVVIALIGPDGVGKSTQTARLTAIFARKFRCASVYLGSNDGDWMRIRGALRSRLSRKKAGDAAHGSADTPKPRGKRSGLHVLGSAIWRLIIAVQRLVAMRKAMRLAASGAIVITDRWPQMLRFGYLDGPSVPPPPTLRIAHLFSRIEQRIFRRMEHNKATLTIHLDCDFATSNHRKPGDITQQDFEQRIELMQEMRRNDPQIVVVDARQSMDAVTADLAYQVWLIAHKSSDSSAPADNLAGHRLATAALRKVAGF